jgi:hypothetical protein
MTEPMTLTYEEQLLLAELLDGPKPDRNGKPERMLVGLGFARRIDIGQIEITAAGVNRLGMLAEARGEADDLFNGDHGF